MKGNGYLGNTTVLQMLNQIKNKQGIKSSNSTGSLVGMITATVDGAASMSIFGGATTSIDAPIGGSANWTIVGFNSYTSIITLSGFGILTPAVDYTIITSTTIRRIGTTYSTGEVYTILLFS